MDSSSATPQARTRSNQAMPLSLELKEMIIDNIAALNDHHATLEAFRASKVWWPEVQTCIRTYLFASLTLDLEDFPKFLDIFEHTPRLKLAVRDLYVCAEEEPTALQQLPIHATHPSAHFLRIASGMNELRFVRFRDFNFLPLDSQFLFHTLQSCMTLTYMSIHGGAASLQLVAALLCALQSLSDLSIHKLRVSDHQNARDPHCSRVLDFQDPATRAEFGVSLTGLVKPLELREFKLETSDGRKPELGGYLIDLLSTSGIVKSIEQVEVDVWHIDASVRQRLQNVLDLTDFLVIQNLESFDAGGEHLQPLRFGTHQTGYHFDVFTVYNAGQAHYQLRDRAFFYWHLHSLATLHHTLEKLSIYIFRNGIEDDDDFLRPLPFLSDDKAAWEALDNFLSSTNVPVTEQLTFYLEVYLDSSVDSAVNLDALWMWWEGLFPQTVQRFEFVKDEGETNRRRTSVMVEGRLK